MKGSILILILSFGLITKAQTISSLVSLAENEEKSGVYDSEHLFGSGFISGFPQDDKEDLYAPGPGRIGIYNPLLFTQPVPPVLTTDATQLEICTGNSTRLTASSNHPIYWYTTPPPIGTPVGTGSCYITPVLHTGYYTYYAVADNNGVKSDITAMEVIMVYPTPSLSIESSAPTLCSGEDATLTVSGTTYYEWENGPVASQFVIKPHVTQAFKVTGVNTAGCRSSAIYTQLVEACTEEDATDLNPGLSSKQIAGEIKQEDKLFSIFPNPNSGAFNIQVNSISESTRIEIYNSLGSLIYKNNVREEKSSVDIREYPDGIYIVRIVENNKVLRQQKVVKE